MTDAQGSAAYYQAHKDDDEEWGDAIQPPVAASRRLATMLSARFAPEEVESIRGAAEAEGSSLSNFIRLAALARAQRVRAPLRSPMATTTGLMVAISNWDIQSGTVANSFGRSAGQLQPR